MNTPMIVLLLITCLALLLAVRGSKKTTQVLENDFTTAGPLLEPHELALLATLEHSLPATCRIFTKLRLSDVVAPAEKLSQKIQHTAQRHADQFSLTFTLCTHPEMKVIAVVECEGGPGTKADTTFVHKVLAANGIPVARFKAKSEYNLVEFWRKLSEVCPGHFEQPSTPASKMAEPNQPPEQIAPSAPVPRAATETTPSQPAASLRREPPSAAAPALLQTGSKPCPTCSGTMLRRHVMKGPHTGKLFLVCSNYPTCRQMVALSDAPAKPSEPVSRAVPSVASAPLKPIPPPPAQTTPAASKPAVVVSTSAPVTEAPASPPVKGPAALLSATATISIPAQPVKTTKPILLTAAVTAQPVSAMPTAVPAVEPQHDQSCPKCGKDLVKMQVTKGTHAGKYFWACSDYPTCRYMAAIKD